MFKRNGACNRPCLLTFRTYRSNSVHGWVSFLFAFGSILIMVNGSTDALCVWPGSYSIKLHPLVHWLSMVWADISHDQKQNASMSLLITTDEMLNGLHLLYNLQKLAALINHLVCPYTDSLSSLASTCALQCFSLLRACLDPWGLKFSPLSYRMFGC
jgi:hypothetical protein